MTIRAAGILFLTPANTALFLKRGAGSDHPGEWAFPGGHLEDGETVQQAAIRETMEETGREVAEADLRFLARTQAKGTLGDVGARSIDAPVPGPNTVTVQGAPAAPVAVIPVAPSEDVDFTTFVVAVDAEFTPTLNYEHTGWAWAAVTNPPEPIHPGCRIALARLSMDELGIARAMAAGHLTSPQQYENLHLFDMRITGTGVAYRQALDEFVWRDPSIYLDPEFLARCNGLPVIVEHPKITPMSGDEYSDRVVGAILLPYIKGNEVWGIAKIYDQDAVAMMRNTQLSTSPAVVFRGAGVNSKMTLEDGSALLIEGKPSLLDHLAICAQGVWDKGGAPAGIVVQDSTGDTVRMDEDEKKAAADAARKDAEERRDAEERARWDAIMGKMDAMMGACDSLSKRVDAMEAARGEPTETAADKARRDAEEAEKKEREDKARKDAEEQERKDAEEAEKKAREDADRAKADSEAVAKRIADLEARIPRARSDEDVRVLHETQARFDTVFQAFGDAAPRPLDGEDPIPYRRRLLSQLKRHSPTWRETNIYAIADDAALDVIEAQVRADAVRAAEQPTDLPEGTLRPIRRPTETGHTITDYAGSPRSWMDPIAVGSRQLVTDFTAKIGA